jgi:uncharacterized damage-inducible protein DinB
MIPLAVVRELFDYNYWARGRQLQACSALTQDQLVRPLGSSFRSLRDTLVHLMAVEWLWLERWRGNSPRTLLRAEDFPTLAAVAEHWRTVEREMREYLATLSDSELELPRTYVSTREQTWTYPLWRMILHLLHHQSYHRGQVTTLLRQLGTQPPPVDFLNALDMGFQL